MALTGQDIARMVGCSVATVSRVLNNTTPVNDSSRRAILKVIEEHGHPRLNRSRQTPRVPKALPSRSGIIEAVVVRTTPFEPLAVDAGGAIVSAGATQEASRFLAPEHRLSNSYFQSIIDGAIAEAKAFNHRVVVQTTNALPGTLVRADADEGRPHGMIIVGDRCDGLKEFIRAAGCPIVTTISDDVGAADSIGIENFAGIAAGFDHLTQLGHTRIGYVAGHRSWPMRERFEAFRLKSLDAGVPSRADWLIDGTTNLGAIRQAALDILARPDRPTAIMTCYDGAAMAVMQAAQQLGLNVPNDLSVVGFDDDAMAGLLNPPLTTLAVPAFGIGQNAVRLLMMRQQRGEASASPEDGAGCGMRVQPRLVVRASTARPSAGGGA